MGPVYSDNSYGNDVKLQKAVIVLGERKLYFSMVDSGEIAKMLNRQWSIMGRKTMAFRVRIRRPLLFFINCLTSGNALSFFETQLPFI